MLLKDDNVILRRFKTTDVLLMAELANNENISRNLRDAFPHPYTIKDAENFINTFINQEPLMIFAIEYDGKYTGNIGLTFGQDVYRKSAEIGYFIGEQYWNKGITTKAVKLIVSYGFEKLDIVRIHTGVFEYNPASMKVLEKSGFKKDCVFEKAVIKQNIILDEHRFSIINPKYKNTSI